MGSAPSVPDKFITAFNAQDDTVESQYQIRVSRHFDAKMSISFNTQEPSIHVEHDRKQYHFLTVPTSNPAQYGQLMQKNGVHYFFYHTDQNGIQLLTARLFPILNPGVKIEVEFWNHRQTIIDLCTFSSLFLATSLVIDKPVTTELEIDFIRANFPALVNVHFNTRCPHRMNFPLSYRHATIHNAAGITLQDIENAACVSLELWDASLTQTDLNAFVSHWFNGRVSSSLEKLSIFDSAVALSLENVGQRDRDGSKGFVIIRDDKTKARIKRDEGRYQFTVLK